MLIKLFNNINLSLVYLNFMAINAIILDRFSI